MDEKIRKQKLGYGRGGRSPQPPGGKKEMANPPVKIPCAPNPSPPTKRQPSKP